MDNFIRTLFDKDEQTCFSQTPYGTELSSAPQLDIFFSINPMHTSRADANVTYYRNILLEIDSLPLDEQLRYMDGIPVTSIVYSGGKSYHFIISLEQPCKTREEYDLLVKRLHKLLPEVDPTTKNPSRFSRLPGAIRPDTGKLQELIYLGNRVNNGQLDALLPILPPQKPITAPPSGFFSTLVVDAMFNPESVMNKLNIESRNQFFFWLGQRLKDGNASAEQKLQIVEQAYANLKDKHDFKWTECMQAARVDK